MDQLHKTLNLNAINHLSNKRGMNITGKKTHEQFREQQLIVTNLQNRPI